MKDGFRKDGKQNQKAQDIENFFAGMVGGIKAARWVQALEYLDRYSQAKRGAPRKKGDTSDNLRQEVVRFTGKSPEELERWVVSYRWPGFASIIKRDGRVDNDQIWYYKWAAAHARRNEDRDYSREQQLTFGEQDGRIIFSCDKKYEYDPQKLAVAWAARREFTESNNEEIFDELPYVHIDNEGKIESKTPIVLTTKQSKELMGFCRKILEKQGDLEPRI